MRGARDVAVVRLHELVTLLTRAGSRVEVPEAELHVAHNEVTWVGGTPPHPYTLSLRTGKVRDSGLRAELACLLRLRNLRRELVSKYARRKGD